MKIILVIFFLKIQSSYLDNSETEATADKFDTIQFVATDSGVWRVKTFATDQDVHIWSLGNSTEDLISVAKKNTQKNYGDVLSESYIIESSDGIEGVKSELRKRGLSDHIEVSKSGMLFWAPQNSSYKTKSSPEQ